MNPTECINYSEFWSLAGGKSSDGLYIGRLFYRYCSPSLSLPCLTILLSTTFHCPHSHNATMSLYNSTSLLPYPFNPHQSTLHSPTSNPLVITKPHLSTLTHRARRHRLKPAITHHASLLPRRTPRLRQQELNAAGQRSLRAGLQHYHHHHTMRA